jgi:uncharacterized protein (DUF2336 family)
LARLGPPALLVALARRPRIGVALASAVVGRGEAEATIALVSNTGAEIDRETLARVLAAHPDDDRLHAALIARAVLPPEIVQRLGVLVAAERLPQLVRRHAAPAAGSVAAESGPGRSLAGDAERPGGSPATGRALTHSARVPANVHR